MPLVLVMVESTPRQLQSIDWAIAVLDEAGKVELRGRECIWEPEFVADDAASDVESFDSGTPVAPVVELQNRIGRSQMSEDRPGLFDLPIDTSGRFEPARLTQAASASG